MAFRIRFGPVYVDADTPEDVLALLARTDADLTAFARLNGTRANARRSRGASLGALDGRVLAVLADHGGAARPKDLVKECKAPAPNVRAVIRDLVKRGAVKSEGKTSSRRIVLVRGAGKR